MDELERVFSQRGWLSRQPPAFLRMFIGLGRAGDWFGHGPALRGGWRRCCCG